ncbi:MAG: hypothetical protein GY816_20275 [Cytophagales bacterium]|nr:hypothetical protein [Cytophagales bacterium]
MFGGFGSMDQMNKSMQRNRELLSKAKESFERRKKIKVAKNIKLKFPKASPKEIEKIRIYLEEKARIRKNKTQMAFITIVLISVFVSSWLVISSPSKIFPSFSEIDTQGKEDIKIVSDSLLASFRTGSYAVFRQLFNHKPSSYQSMTHGDLHRFVSSRDASVRLKDLEYFDYHALVSFNIKAMDSLITPKYRFEIFDNKPVITDFTIHKWTE